MFYHQEFGIDLGSDTIKIYDKKLDSITVEKNYAAVRDRREVCSIGNEAYMSLNRAPSNVRVSSPMVNGRIGDVRQVEAILHTLLFRQQHYLGKKPALYFAVPPEMSEIERRAYASIARRGKLRNCPVYLVEKPVADALALGIPVIRTKGAMIINIGAGSTALSIIADGMVVLSRCLPLGGNYLNEAITAAVRRREQLAIGFHGSEQLKLELAFPGHPSEDSCVVETIDISDGHPLKASVSGATVTGAVEDALQPLALEIKAFVERIPPQIKSVIDRDGVIFTGGSTLMKGISEFIGGLTGLKLVTPEDPSMTTILGIKELMLHSGAKQFIYSPNR